MISGVFLLAIFLAASGAQAQQLYRWVDEEGRVRYSDTPPPASAKDVQKKKYSTGPAAAVPYATQRAMRDYPVTLYTSPDCGKPCADGKALLEKRGIPYSETVVRDEGDIDRLKRATGQNQVPALVVGPDAVGGYEAGSWNAALSTAGYPANAGLPGTAKK